MRRRAILLMLTVALGLGLAACGSQPSAQEQARTKVCDARDDIGKQVDRLSSLTLSSTTVDEVSSSLTAIQNDLRTISENEASLTATTRQQVRQATDQFTAQVRTVAADLGTNLSLSQAQAQLSAALRQLGSAYRSSLEQIRCG